jgi:hypothetical protein
MNLHPFITKLKMKMIQIKTAQCFYRLGLLEQEFQYLLAMHPADISVDEYEWMQIGIQQIPDCLIEIKNEEKYESSLTLWFQKVQLIEKLCLLRKLSLQPDFIDAKEKISNFHQISAALKKN